MDVSSGLPASSAASSRAESSRSTAAPSRPLVLSPPPLTSAGSQTSAAEHKGKVMLCMIARTAIVRAVNCDRP